MVLLGLMSRRQIDQEQDRQASGSWKGMHLSPPDRIYWKSKAFIPEVSGSKDSAQAYSEDSRCQLNTKSSCQSTTENKPLATREAPCRGFPWPPKCAHRSFLLAREDKNEPSRSFLLSNKTQISETHSISEKFIWIFNLMQT